MEQPALPAGQHGHAGLLAPGSGGTAGGRAGLGEPGLDGGGIGGGANLCDAGRPLGRASLESGHRGPAGVGGDVTSAWPTAETTGAGALKRWAKPGTPSGTPTGRMRGENQALEKAGKINVPVRFSFVPFSFPRNFTILRHAIDFANLAEKSLDPCLTTKVVNATISSCSTSK